VDLGDPAGGRDFGALWGLALAAFIAFDLFAANTLDGSSLRLAATVARVAWTILALATTLLMRRDLLRALAASPRDTARAPDVPILYDTVPAGTLPPADDAFWRAAAAFGSDGAVPLLETTPALERRWLLITTAGPSERPAPGSVVTVFPAPQPWLRQAPEYYGLVQRTPDGPIRFQLVLPSRVADFRAAAKGAHRAELYASDDPSARAAVTPSISEVPST
jgi:hypothetical protein